jgi:BUD22
LKSKSIIESGLLPRYVKIGNNTSQGSPEELAATSNVTARLYNTKPVKGAMPHIIGSIYAILGIQNPSATMKNKFIERGIAELEDEDRDKPAKYGIDEDVNQFDAPSWDEYPGVGDVPTELAASESNLNSNSDLESNDAHDFDDKHDKLVGASSDDESNVDVDEVAAMGHPQFDLGPQEQPKDTSTSFSDSSQPLSPPPRPKKSTKLAQQGPLKPGSTFLPTLMGGYWSGSESATDDEDISTRKKNRPGQQARRALWEKKFGAGANHLKGQASGKNRAKDWDPRRGARGAEDSRFRRGRVAARGSRATLVNNREQSARENAVAMKPRARSIVKKDDAGPLHPSWEAAKKAKEAKQMASFQGKKVVFE